jgi:hypothetical protein
MKFVVLIIILVSSPSIFCQKKCYEKFSENVCNVDSDCTSFICGGGDPFFRNTALLLNGDSNSIVDSSYTTPKVVTISGHTALSSVHHIFGRSISFDGNGDYLTISSSPDFDFLLRDYTIELWFWANSVGGGSARTLISRYQAWNSLVALFMDITTSGKIVFRAGDNILLIIQSSTIVSSNRWYHVAVARSSGTIIPIHCSFPPTRSRMTSFAQNKSSSSSWPFNSKMIHLVSSCSKDF